jgi:hypothetical protein
MVFSSFYFAMGLCGLPLSIDPHRVDVNSILAAKIATVLVPILRRDVLSSSLEATRVRRSQAATSPNPIGPIQEPSE